MRHFFYLWIFTIGLFVTSGIASAAPATKPTTKKTLTAELAQKMLWAKTRQIRTLDLQYTIQERAGDVKAQNIVHAWLKWDLMHHFVHAKTVRARSPSSVLARVWVRNSDKEWTFTAANLKHRENARDVVIQRPMPWKNAQSAYGTYVGMQRLRKIWIPWHIDLLRAGYFFKRVQLHLIGLQDAAHGRHALVYQMILPATPHQKKRAGYIRYTFSIDHGMKLYSTEVYEQLANGKKKMNDLITRQGHVLSNGVWFPKRYEHKYWKPSGKLRYDDVLEFQSVHVNVKFKKDTFTYTPTWGTIVHDRIAHQTYGYGWHGLHHPPSTEPATIPTHIKTNGQTLGK